MAISISNNYINSATNGATTLATATSSGISFQSSGSETVNLKSGQTLSGEVVSKDGNNITLKLNNGQLLNARLNGNLDLSLGKLLSFEVSSNSSQNSIILKPLYSNLSNTSTISTALKAAGLALTDTNISMTRSMMEEGMSIDKNSLTGMAKDVNAFPDAAPSSIVQMVKLGMAVDEINVTQYENYRNFEHQIINDVNNLAQSLTDVLSSGTDDAYNLKNVQDILNLIDTSILEDSIDDDTMMKTGEEDALFSKTNQDFPELSAENESINNSINRIKDSILKIFSPASGSPEILGNEENPESLAESVTEESTKTEMDILKQLSLSSNVILPEETGSKETVDFLKNVLSAIENNEMPDKQEAVDNLFKALKTDDIKNTITESLKSQLLISPDKIGKEGSIEDLYSRIIKFTQKAMDISQNMGNEASVIQNSAQNLQDNVNFMNQLNQFVNYVQLPLKMYQENAHGELYVYSNKKNISESNGNLTALLHLDMEHLGPMDVYVSMQNYTKVSTNFRLADEEILDFIEEHIHILDEKLTAKGYQMTTNVTTKGSITGEDNPITEEFLKESPETPKMKMISNLQFDVRA